jgi:hypothetical protein
VELCSLAAAVRAEEKGLVAAASSVVAASSRSTVGCGTFGVVTKSATSAAKGAMCLIDAVLEHGGERIVCLQMPRAQTIRAGRSRRFSHPQCQYGRRPPLCIDLRLPPIMGQQPADCFCK